MNTYAETVIYNDIRHISFLAPKVAMSSADFRDSFDETDVAYLRGKTAVINIEKVRSYYKKRYGREIMYTPVSVTIRNFPDSFVAAVKEKQDLLVKALPEHLRQFLLLSPIDQESLHLTLVGTLKGTDLNHPGEQLLEPIPAAILKVLKQEIAHNLQGVFAYHGDLAAKVILNDDGGIGLEINNPKFMDWFNDAMQRSFPKSSGWMHRWSATLTIGRIIYIPEHDADILASADILNKNMLEGNNQTFSLNHIIIDTILGGQFSSRGEKSYDSVMIKLPLKGSLDFTENNDYNRVAIILSSI